MNVSAVSLTHGTAVFSRPFSLCHISGKREIYINYESSRTVLVIPRLHINVHTAVVRPSGVFWNILGSLEFCS